MGLVADDRLADRVPTPWPRPLRSCRRLARPAPRLNLGRGRRSAGSPERELRAAVGSLMTPATTARSPEAKPLHDAALSPTGRRCTDRTGHRPGEASMGGKHRLLRSAIAAVAAVAAGVMT